MINVSDKKCTFIYTNHIQALFLCNSMYMYLLNIIKPLSSFEHVPLNLKNVSMWSEFSLSDFSNRFMLRILEQKLSDEFLRTIWDHRIRLIACWVEQGLKNVVFVMSIDTLLSNYLMKSSEQNGRYEVICHFVLMI